MIKPIFKLSGLLLALVIVMSSCGGTPESKLIGTWKAQKVETDFDEQFTTPEMLRQVVEMQKETFFKIIDDSTLIIISPGNTHETSWELNPSDQAISYFFEGDPKYLNKLGVFSEGKIISESKTPLGIITIYYEKE
ncbi:MAG: hypothetical protein QM503_03470 [Bacteroidota bacterium]